MEFKRLIKEDYSGESNKNISRSKLFLGNPKREIYWEILRPRGNAFASVAKNIFA